MSSLCNPTELLVQAGAKQSNRITCTGRSETDLQAARQVFNGLQPSSPACSSQAEVILACIINTSVPAEGFLQTLEPLILKVGTAQIAA